MSFPTLPPRSGGATSETTFPFKILLIKNKDKWKRGVYFGSKLLKSLDYADVQTITGLLTTLTPEITDSGWVDTENGDYIWLEIEFLSWPNIKTASIKSKKIDGANAFGGGAVEHDNAAFTPNTYIQKKARLVLGIVSIIDNVATVDQRITSNLRMEITGGTALNSSKTNSHFVAVSYPYPI